MCSSSRTEFVASEPALFYNLPTPAEHATLPGADQYAVLQAAQAAEELGCAAGLTRQTVSPVNALSPHYLPTSPPLHVLHPQVLTNMLCSKQHEQEFVELNLALSSALNNLNLALQPMYDVSGRSTASWPATALRPGDGGPGCRAAAGRRQTL